MSEAGIRAGAVMDRMNRDPIQPIGAEIGVAIGQMSECLFKLGVGHLYMVDSWAECKDQPQAYIESGDWHATCTREEQESHYRTALDVTDFARDRRTVMRMPSIDAALIVPDASLDFCFIDADHSYEGARSDIEAWKTKVKPGGWLCGHDYGHPPTVKPWTWGPKKAVDEAVAAYGWKLQTGPNWTWFVKL